MRYDFRCVKHGDFEIQQRLSEHTGFFECPTCAVNSKQVILNAPGIDLEGMADAGCPGAILSSGDRMERRHKKAGQDHHDVRDDITRKDAMKTQKRLAEGSAWDR